MLIDELLVRIFQKSQILDVIYGISSLAYPSSHSVCLIGLLVQNRDRVGVRRGRRKVRGHQRRGLVLLPELGFRPRLVCVQRLLPAEQAGKTERNGAERNGTPEHDEAELIHLEES